VNKLQVNGGAKITGAATVGGDLTVTGASTNFRNAIKAVDGAGSELDADTVDTKHASDFVATSTYTASDVLTKIQTVDGSGSGLDAGYGGWVCAKHFGHKQHSGA